MIKYQYYLEYSKQHPIFSDIESNIPNIVDHFAEICEKFEDSLKNAQNKTYSKGVSSRLLTISWNNVRV